LTFIFVLFFESSKVHGDKLEVRMNIGDFRKIMEMFAVSLLFTI